MILAGTRKNRGKSPFQTLGLSAFLCSWPWRQCGDRAALVALAALISETLSIRDPTGH